MKRFLTILAETTAFTGCMFILVLYLIAFGA